MGGPLLALRTDGAAASRTLLGRSIAAFPGVFVRFLGGLLGDHVMWNIELFPWWHFIVRAAVVYVFVLVILRFTGKRQVGQLAPFDLVLLLILSNAVQNSMNGGDNSITGGLISATTLVAINWCVGWLVFRSKRIEALVEGRPVLLVHNGIVDHLALRSVQMTMHELNASLRACGYAGPEEVRFAVLENNGHVAVIPKQKNGNGRS
jgi:uncharacterized membrane protein YcaP (DUF421 family)